MLKIIFFNETHDFVHISILSQDKFLVRFDLRSISSATPVFALHLQVVCRHSDPRLCVPAYKPLAYMLVYFLFFDWPTNWRPALTWACGTRFLRKSGMDEKVKCTSPFALKAAGCPIFRPYAVRMHYGTLLCCYEREKNNWSQKKYIYRTKPFFSTARVEKLFKKIYYRMFDKHSLIPVCMLNYNYLHIVSKK